MADDHQPGAAHPRPPSSSATQLRSCTVRRAILASLVTAALAISAALAAMALTGLDGYRAHTTAVPSPSPNAEPRL